MDNDNKKSTNGKVPNDHQMTAKSGVTEFQTSYPSVTPTDEQNKTGYVKTEQVAKNIGVTKQAVIKWRKLGWFSADLVDHNGVYLYSVERVEQLKAVYRRDWQTAWRGNSTQSEEK